MKEKEKMEKDKDLISIEIADLNTEAEDIRGRVDKLNKKISKLKKKSDLVSTAYFYTIHIPKLINIGV